MQAYFNDPKIKEKYVARMKSHIADDALIRGTGWDGLKGCAVGCTLEKYEHAHFESELGIPEWLARWEDAVFEGLPENESRDFPLRFLEAIHEGFEKWDSLRDKMAIARLKRLPPVPDFPEVKNAIKGVITALQTGIGLVAARSAAWSAALSAAQSDAYAAWSAAWSAADTAQSAAQSDAYAAWSAAWSAADTAQSAAWSAAWSATGADARSDAQSAAYAAGASARSAADAARSAAWSAESSAFFETLKELA